MVDLRIASHLGSESTNYYNSVYDIRSIYVLLKIYILLIFLTKLESARGCARVREGARGCARVREGCAGSIPA